MRDRRRMILLLKSQGFRESCTFIRCRIVPTIVWGNDLLSNNTGSAQNPKTILETGSFYPSSMEERCFSTILGFCRRRKSQ